LSFWDGDCNQQKPVNANLLMLISSLRVLDEINLVLQDENVFQLHDFNGCQMLRGLWLRA
jgi:hypothetical protein